MGTKKNFVIDTNVILHDYDCLENFQENDIYIPISVLEELDKFKKGNDQINYNAREFVRALDNITDEELFSKGTLLGKDRGRLFIPVTEVLHKAVKNSFQEVNTDHKILSVVLNLTERYPDTKTILVTKDINLRMKARSLGIVSEDYATDKVISKDIFGREHPTFEIEEADLIDNLYNSKEGLPFDSFKLPEAVDPNDTFVLSNGRASVLARYNPFKQTIVRVKKEKRFGIEPRNAEQAFAMEVLCDPDIKLVGLSGKAGTGKTLLALAGALSQNQNYKQILLARPIVALANKDLGFLPGDEKEKIAPYMQPLFDNLTVIKHQCGVMSAESKIIEDLSRNNALVIEALAYIRGRSLSEAFCIIDEAQNLTPHEIKTIITRAGEGTKMVFTGDIGQIDSPYLDAESNGLAYMIDKMRGQSIFAHVNLVKGERSALSELASDLL